MDPLNLGSGVIIILSVVEIMTWWFIVGCIHLVRLFLMNVLFDNDGILFCVLCVVSFVCALNSPSKTHSYQNIPEM